MFQIIAMTGGAVARVMRAQLTKTCLVGFVGDRWVGSPKARDSDRIQTQDEKLPFSTMVDYINIIG